MTNSNEARSPVRGLEKRSSTDLFTARECEQHQHEEEEEFHNVHNHPGQGDLQGAEVGIHGENVHQFQRTARIQPLLSTVTAFKGYEIAQANINTGTETSN